MRKRVVVVDDDDISRRGLTELLADRPEIQVTAALTHDEALRWEEEWDEVDVALIDAADERQTQDHFPGVRVVDQLRRRRDSNQTMVVIITGRFLDDALRRRMREARADFFYHRSELQETEALVAAVLNTSGSGNGVPDVLDPESVFRHGVTPASRVNEAVRYASETGLNPGVSQPLGRRSRAWLRFRREFNEIARLTPVNLDGTPPDREQPSPSMPQIDRFLEWATRAKGQR